MAGLASLLADPPLPSSSLAPAELLGRLVPEGISASTKTTWLPSGPAERHQPGEEEEEEAVLPLLEMLRLALELLLQGGEAEQELQEANRPESQGRAVRSRGPEGGLYGKSESRELEPWAVAMPIMVPIIMPSIMPMIMLMLCL